MEKITLNVLEKIKSEDFYLKLPDFPSKAMRVVFLKLAEHDELTEELNQGVLTDDSLRNFVNSLLQEFRVGERFLYDYTLAFLAVCLERRNSPFAEEYLKDLVALHLAEISLAPQVAKESLAVYNSKINNIHFTFSPAVLRKDLESVDCVSSFSATYSLPEVANG